MAASARAHHTVEITKASVDRDELFVIGGGIGPVWRLARMLLLVSPLFSRPVAQHALPAFAASVAGFLLVIAAVAHELR